MKDTKRRLEWFSFYDHTGLEAHLGRMAEQGWLLEKIGNFTWHYHRIEPKKLTFSVSYFPRASMFDPGPSEEQETFYDFCAHTGWTLAASSGQMQVFYNERPDPVPIDTDPALEVEAIHRSAKKSGLISQFLLLAVGVLNFGQFLWRLFDDTVATLASSLSLFSFVCWPVLFVLEGVELTTYFCWRRRALKAAEQGEFLATKSHPMLQKLALLVVLIGLAWCLAYVRGGLLISTVISLICMFGLVFVIAQIRELLKRNKVSAGVNRVITFGACVVLPLIVMVLVVALVLRTGGLGTGESGELPLTLADLTEEPADGELDQNVLLNQSPLLASLSVSQYFWVSRDGGDPPPHWLEYSVTQVKVSALYEVCRDDLLHQYDRYDRHFSPIDAAPWGAQEAYQSAYEDSGPMNDYLLCYPDRIVEIYFDWEPTPAQMAVVAEKLSGR